METTTSQPSSQSSSQSRLPSAGLFTPPSGALEQTYMENLRRTFAINQQLLDARMALVECRAHANAGNCMKVVAVVDGVLEPVLRRIREGRA